jgi:predicted flap endonuclease-1-like 5' DNA nuclease
LPLSKLRGLTSGLRVALKARRITNCDQLLAAAAPAAARLRLCAEAALDEEAVLRLVRRADIARVNGIGAIFGMMLEELGIVDVLSLAAADPAQLHDRLRRYNEQERISRRSPTPAEVENWVAQALRLPRLIS